MNRRLLLCLAALGMSIHLAACTSGDKKDDVESASSDVQDLNDPSVKDDALLSDSLPEDSLGGKTADTMAPGDSTASSTEPPMVLPESTPSDNAMMGTTDTPAPPAATDLPTTPTESLGSSSASSSMESAPPETPKVIAPLQKVATKPWKVGKDWFNGVYFARPGDTLKSISMTIYGENRTALLKKGNPSFKERAPKPGDKVYYASVKRPGEQEQMLNYYEETGVAPEVYVAKGGDNLRKISKQLLGYDNAWKETWASNAALESKGALTAGTEVRYWASAATASAPETPAAPTNAETSVATQAPQEMTPPPIDQQMPPPPAQAMNDLPPPPPPPSQPDMPPPPPPVDAMNDLPPPPPPSQAMNDIPPPPPPIEQAPPAAAASAKAKVGESAGGMDEDTMMALGTVAVAAAGIAALLVIRRRRKQNALDAGINDSTHVG